MVISAVKPTQCLAGPPATACKACEAQGNPLPTTVSDPSLTPYSSPGSLEPLANTGFFLQLAAPTT